MCLQFFTPLLPYIITVPSCGTQFRWTKVQNKNCVQIKHSTQTATPQICCTQQKFVNEHGKLCGIAQLEHYRYSICMLVFASGKLVVKACVARNYVYVMPAAHHLRCGKSTPVVRRDWLICRLIFIVATQSQIVAAQRWADKRHFYGHQMAITRWQGEGEVGVAYWVIWGVKNVALCGVWNVNTTLQACELCTQIIFAATTCWLFIFKTKNLEDCGCSIICCHIRFALIWKYVCCKINSA